MGGASVQNCKFPFKLKTQIVPIASQCCYQTPYLTRIHLMLFLLIFEWFYKISRWFWRIFDIQAKTIPFDAIENWKNAKTRHQIANRGKSLEWVRMTDITTHQAPMAISTPNSWFVSLSSWSWLWPAVSPSCSSVRFISCLRPQSVSCVCVKLLLFARPIDK